MKAANLTKKKKKTGSLAEVSEGLHPTDMSVYECQEQRCNLA